MLLNTLRAFFGMTPIDPTVTLRGKIRDLTDDELKILNDACLDERNKRYAAMHGKHLFEVDRIVLEANAALAAELDALPQDGCDLPLYYGGDRDTNIEIRDGGLVEDTREVPDNRPQTKTPSRKRKGASSVTARKRTKRSP